MATTAAAPTNAKIAFKGKPEKEPAPEKDWEAEDALRTMQRAEEHQADKPLMKRVGAHVEKQSASLAKVQAKLQARGMISDKQAEKLEKRKNKSAK